MKGAHRIAILACHLTLVWCGTVMAWQPDKNDDEQAAAAAPQLRLEAGGPTAFVTSLAFSPTNDTLFIGGWDKRVDTWRANRAAGQYHRDPAGAFRIPIGPETWGAINAVAVSPDGQQVAVGGKALARGVGDWQHPGWLVPSIGLDAESQDRGTIYLFDTRTREARQLRGHRGAVLALTYAWPPDGKSRTLVSAAAERDPSDSSKWYLVARAWNTNAGVDAAGNPKPAYLAGVNAAPCAQASDVRPALAAWHFGAGPREIAVALADDSGKLCLANLEAQRAYRVADGQHNRTVAYWPARGELITGSTNKLKLWKVPSRIQGPPVAVEQGELRLAPQASPTSRLQGVVPQAMMVSSSAANGRPDRATVVTRHVLLGDKRTLREEDHLEVFELARPPRRQGQDIRLWDNGDWPALAVSPDGAQVAVTGNKRHEVHIFQQSDLDAGRVEPRQVVRGEGERFADVAFASHGERLGLLLAGSSETKQPGRPPRQPLAGDWVFDADRSEVTRQLDGWRTLAPDAGWTVEHGLARDAPSAPQRAYLRVRHGNDAGTPVWLPSGHELSDYAVLPPGGGRPAPFLAIATHELGEPSLYLYDGHSGQRFRRLSGHVERLRSLAFHPDGSLLVSTADDRMVCVWSLLDWRECLGERGWLTGLAVERRGGRLVASRSVANEPIAGGKILPGDTIEALVTPDGRQPLTQPHDLYTALLQRRPGETVTLISSRAGAPARQVTLKLGQATDQRLPLFSLYCTKKAERPGQPHSDLDWLGWSPSGAYDASGAEIEGRIGWHFNTGRSGSPVRFALAAEYVRLRRAGLLGELLRDPARAPAPAENPRPKMSLWVEPNRPDLGDDAPIFDAASGPARLADSDATLYASVEGLALGMVRSVGWREPGGDLHPMQVVDSAKQEYAADLSDQTWDRGERTIECVVATLDVQRPTLTRQIVLAFSSPPPPVFEDVLPKEPILAAADKRLPFHVKVTTNRRRPAPIRVALVNLVDGREDRRWQWTDKTTIDATIDLQPGENRIRLTAVPSDAPAATAADETAVLERKIYYQAKAPQLNLRAVASNGETRVLGRTDANLAEAWGLDDATISIEGSIEAKDALSKAEWRWEGSETWHSFGEFQKGTLRLDVEEKIALDPGQHRLECRASTAGKQAATSEASLVIDYRPRLPQLGEIRLVPRQLTEGVDESEVLLSGEWNVAESLRPFSLVVIRDGQKLDRFVELDEANHRFRAKVPIAWSAANRFQLQVTNEGGAKLIDAPQVDVARPPRIVDVDAPAESPLARLDIRFSVESPKELELREIKVGEVPLPLDSAQFDAATQRWLVVAKDVPLRQGSNRLAIMARNDDGWNVRPAAVQVDVIEPPPPVAEISFDRPMPGQTYSLPECNVAFTVTSSTRLKRVTVLRDQLPPRELDIESQVADERGGFVFDHHLRVPLTAGKPHVISVVAINDGGERRAQRSVVYLPPPVEVLVDRIEWLGPNPAEVVAERHEEGYRFGEALPGGDALLSGRVRWAHAADPQTYNVDVIVNGYRQLPEKLGPVGARPNERPWKARVCLNRDDNRVVVAVPDLASDASNSLSFQVGCDAPIDRQRLHMLVIGIGDVMGKRLEDDALQAVGGTRTTGAVAPKEATAFHTPAFPAGRLYRPDIREIDPQGFRAKVRDVLRHIERTRTRELGNDLFMLYYRGGELIDRNGRFYLQTSLGEGLKVEDACVSGEELERLFDRNLGAHLCLLDVKRGDERIAAGRASSGPLSTRHRYSGILRSVWLRTQLRPEDTWLLVRFQEALSESSTLADIRTEIVKVYQTLSAQYPNGLELEAQIPPGLGDLVLGQK